MISDFLLDIFLKLFGVSLQDIIDRMCSDIAQYKMFYCGNVDFYFNLFDLVSIVIIIIVIVKKFDLIQKFSTHNGI